MVISSISRRRNGLMALSVIGGSCLGLRLKAPQSQDRTPASRYSTCCHQLPRERFSPMPHCCHCPAPVRMSQDNGEPSFGGGAKIKKSTTEPMPPGGDCYENRSHAA